MLRKGVKSFYDWCIDNNKNYLEFWDYELNEKDPKDIGYRGPEKYYFKCENGKHESYLYSIVSLTIDNSKGLHCPICGSIYQWCIDNNRTDIIDSWDEDKNTVSMKLVSKSSSKKAWFTFEHYSYYYPVHYITQKNKKSTDPVSKYYNSLGYYLISNYGASAIERYWSSKNEKSPFEYDRGSSNKVWFKCVEKKYHADYQMACYSFTGKSQCRCPSCASKIIHPLDSFAQFNIDRYGQDWIEKYWCKDNIVDPFNIAINNQKDKVHIRCMNVDYHDFWITPSNYSRGECVCDLCNIKGTGGKVHPNDSLGQLYPDVIYIWSNKNDKTAFEYSTKSHAKIYLKCENGIHEDYLKKICDYTRNPFRGCPICSNYISSYERLTREYLNTLGYSILHEHNCTIVPINPKTNYPLPLDNEIVELNLICEVMGQQHYEVTGFHILSAKHNNTTPEEEFKYTCWKDEYKKQYVLDHGYKYLELPYTSFCDDTYKKMIDNKIKTIINSESVTTAGYNQ